MLELGIKAPDFTLPDQNGKMVSLADFQGKKVMGTARITYLINEEGVIEKAFTRVKTAENAVQMMGELQA